LRVDVLLSGKLIERDGIERCERLRPIDEARLLRGGVNLRKVIARVAHLIAGSGQLLLPPIPLLGVEGAQTCVRR
jgi:hypothetical protein